MLSEITIVLLHGAGTGAWVWERVLKELSMRAVALDIPGRTDGATPDNCAAALVAELDRRGIGSVGWSCTHWQAYLLQHSRHDWARG